MVKAKELLAETALSATDVCFSTGFENIAHFSKVFKERFGLPPSEFRQHGVFCSNRRPRPPCSQLEHFAPSGASLSSSCP
ncbi:AraC family transcriptional regulator [Cohnella sp. REN36]|uniref:helix-turn-helix domain-containing protein n=1 Tax=Cohnella sp. REN36 TaxID=2887347 RepID=UPI0021039276|nr:helix-turn-helix domain-containing protein [Cohnella sp. REN36]